MPSVVFGWLINLLQLLVRGIDLVHGLLSRVAGNIAEENRRIGDCKTSTGALMVISDHWLYSRSLRN